MASGTPDYSLATKTDITAQSIAQIAVDIATQSLANLKVDINTQSLATLAIDIAAQTLTTLGVNIKAQDLTNLSVDLAAQTIGNIAVDLAAQTMGNLSVDLAANSFGTLNVDILAQTVGNLAVDLVAQTIGNLNIDLAAASMGNLGVSLNAATLGNLAIDIAAQAIGDLNIDINSQSLTQVIQRPKFGAAQRGSYADTYPADSDSDIITISAKGVIYGGYLRAKHTSSHKFDRVKIIIDGQTLFDRGFTEMLTEAHQRPLALFCDLLHYDDTNYRYIVGFPSQVTFESSCVVNYRNKEHYTTWVESDIYYATI